MYMITFEQQEHDFIVIHPPTKTRKDHNQRFLIDFLLHFKAVVPSIPTNP